MLEARAVLWSVRRRARRMAGHGKRFLHLGDNVSVCLAFAKGRAHDYNLLTMVRRTNMYLLACGMRMSLRWVPSKWNPSDDASRGRGPGGDVSVSPAAPIPGGGDVGGARPAEGDGEEEDLLISDARQLRADRE
eukprot:5671745-Heterocapsa_arctica.AAC.1